MIAHDWVIFPAAILNPLGTHSEPELALDGFEMNLGYDYHPSPVPHVG